MYMHICVFVVYVFGVHMMWGVNLWFMFCVCMVYVFNVSGMCVLYMHIMCICVSLWYMFDMRMCNMYMPCACVSVKCVHVSSTDGEHHHIILSHKIIALLVEQAALCILRGWGVFLSSESLCVTDKDSCISSMKLGTRTPISKSSSCPRG